MYKNGEIEKVLEIFERSFQGRLRMDRNKNKDEWKKHSWFYENGETNEAFKCFLNGYSYAKSLAIQGEWSN